MTEASSSYYMIQSEITRAAFDSGPDAIVVVDKGGKILAVNQQAELLSGRPRTELVGQKIEVLVPADLRERHLEHRAQYLRMPYRRLMGPSLVTSIVQVDEEGKESTVPVDINLAPSSISIGTVVVATVRLREGWGGAELGRALK